MEPGLDKFGLRVEAGTSSKFRENDGHKHTNLRLTDAFKPYGNTSSHYKNYIMNYPRL